ncbi:uracil-DNA glycosylase [Thermogymnomonas acidicola]|uniref:Type-5 uracil-DNA glycosylase n=1 Tax=Thermogymnomonas acidicola TaxID=399579 RepID=A0AA37BSE5_9ARCH|nr:uracil-DNA glycosylase [Thermogymnomonas acidicola]GGM78271.1 uracil-DNA glycosylase [Thermogymnomonas acidicola]
MRNTCTDSAGWKSIDEMNSELIECVACPRLVKFREEVAQRYKRYRERFWSRPVPGFGDISGRILILGLAPAPAGGNRTGRVFTGDRSSDFLVSCLHEVGITNKPTSESRDDGLQYRDAYITAAVKCVPPDNRPEREEMERCSRYLDYEICSMGNLKAVVALGSIAFSAFKSYAKRRGADTRGMRFEHGKSYSVLGVRLFCLYHPSPRNVNTGKLTRDAFIRGLKEVLQYVSAQDK